MKALAIGFNEEIVDSMIDCFADLNISVMGRIINGNDTEAAVRSIQEGINKGYGLVIASIDDNIGASILLNRDKRISAAACSNDYDVELAKKNNANVLVFNENIDLSKNIFNVFKQNTDTQKSTTQQNPAYKKQPKINVKQQIQVKESINEISNDNFKTSQKKGFLKNIKDSLGIIDE